MRNKSQVTNIRVAADAREHARRTEEEEDFRLRKERLETESKAANEKFEEVKDQNNFPIFQVFISKKRV